MVLACNLLAYTEHHSCYLDYDAVLQQSQKQSRIKRNSTNMVVPRPNKSETIGRIMINAHVHTTPEKLSVNGRHQTLATKSYQQI